MEWNDETYILFFLENHFCFLTNETIQIYKNKRPTGHDSLTWVT